MEPRFMLDKESICYGCQYFKAVDDCDHKPALEDVVCGGACDCVNPCFEGSQNDYGLDDNMNVYVVVVGNYALSKNMYAFSSKKLAEGFRKHIWNESKTNSPINIFEMEIDKAVLKENDM